MPHDPNAPMDVPGPAPAMVMPPVYKPELVWDPSNPANLPAPSAGEVDRSPTPAPAGGAGSSEEREKLSI